jgi:ATP-binding cassette subfamily C protein
MDKVIDLPMSYLSKTEKGYVQSRISECGSVGSLFSPMFIGLFIGLLDSFLALITIFTLNYKLSIIILLLSPLFFFSAKMSTKKISKSLMVRLAI